MSFQAINSSYSQLSNLRLGPTPKCKIFILSHHYKRHQPRSFLGACYEGSPSNTSEVAEEDTYIIYLQNERFITNMDGNNPSNTNFRSQDSLEGGQGNQNFEISDFLEFDDWGEEDASFLDSSYSFPQNPSHAASHQSLVSVGGSSSQGTVARDSGSDQQRRERVAFKTMSEIEVLDDGFKWRKYGKKMVKNSPNPRNYYKCSVAGCPVKKRVERDKEDPRYVITTYEGVHTHEGPS